MRDRFLLRSDIAFLNHGSFGACPQVVLDEYWRLQRELEAEPVEFIARRLNGMMREVREELGAFMGADASDIVQVPNATTGVNIVAHSLKLGRGDEVLTCDHEYGACDRAWNFLAGRQGFTYRAVEIPLPVDDPAEFVEKMIAAFTPATRVLYLSQITSPTALTLPIEPVVRAARERGIITVIDAAHSPGQIPMNLDAMGADFTTGNLHKWLCTPKGSAFLHARREMQDLLEPLVVSWGWEERGSDAPHWSGETRFIDLFQYTGTVDPTPFLTVPTAIRFHHDPEWQAAVARSREMLREVRPRFAEALNATPTAPDDRGWFQQMSAFLLPEGTNAKEMQGRLFNEFGVEIPTVVWKDRWTIRIAVNGYTEQWELDRLMEGVTALCERDRLAASR